MGTLLATVFLGLSLPKSVYLIIRQEQLSNLTAVDASMGTALWRIQREAHEFYLCFHAPQQEGKHAVSSSLWQLSAKSSITVCTISTRNCRIFPSGRVPLGQLFTCLGTSWTGMDPSSSSQSNALEEKYLSAFWKAITLEVSFIFTTGFYEWLHACGVTNHNYLVTKTARHSFSTGSKLPGFMRLFH